MSLEVDEIHSVLTELGVPLSASEAHGLACGLLCSQATATAKARWFTELLDAAELEANALAAHAESVRRLDRWFETSQEQLDAAELVFEPLLPDDESAIEHRIDALGDFCAGFTYGVGLGAAAQGNRQFPADTRELLEDFQAIDGAGQVELPSAAEDAATESDYLELVEYVRVGVLLILEELKPVERASSVADKAPTGSGPAPSSPDFSQLH